MGVDQSRGRFAEKNIPEVEAQQEDEKQEGQAAECEHLGSAKQDECMVIALEMVVNEDVFERVRMWF